MYTAKQVTDTSVTDGHKAYLRKVEREVTDIGKQVTVVIVPPFLADLRHEPGKPKYQIEWTSERQHRFVLAKLREENNLPYQRSHRLSQGWEVAGITAGGAFILTVQHGWSGLKYVMGNISFIGGQRLRQQSLQPMQRFHLNTGWRPAVDIITRWYKEADSLFKKLLKARFEATVKASTRKRNR